MSLWSECAADGQKFRKRWRHNEGMRPKRKDEQKMKEQRQGEKSRRKRLRQETGI